MLNLNTIKLIRSLKLKKYREEHKLFVIEGKKSINEAVKHHHQKIKFIFTSDSELFNSLSRYKNLNIELVSNKEMSRISFLKSSSNAVAIIQFFEIHSRKKSSLSLALDGIQNPGNFGTIIRIADWFEIKEIICSYDTVDLYNPKVVQATMGSLFRVKVLYTNLFDYLNQFNGKIIGACMNGVDVKQSKINQSGILVMGNEGSGISNEIQPLINEKISIIGNSETESLNVSIACGILISHLK